MGYYWICGTAFDSKMSWRRWSDPSRLSAMSGKRPKLVKHVLKRWNIVRGDTVQILAGKDKGKQGRVSMVMRPRNAVIVEGLNAHVRVMPKTGDFPGGRMLSEAPLHVSNVALVDPSDGKPCRVKYKFTESGEKVRVSRRTGSVIPKSPELRERRDFKSRSGYVEGSFDTKAEDVIEVTYVPSLVPFAKSILQSMQNMKITSDTS